MHGRQGECNELLLESSVASPSTSKLISYISGDKSGCLGTYIISSIVIAMMCLFLFIGRDYVKYVLFSIEHNNFFAGFIIFLLLYTVVSFPFTWGYMLLNLAIGYMYGVFLGMVIIIVCACFGVTISHLLMRRFFMSHLAQFLKGEMLTNVVRVIEAENGYRFVALARLTPIPFGLQNALFAICNISLPRYMAVSLLGMTPMQALYSYIGSTLRSMEEVVSKTPQSTLACIVFGGQIVAALCLMMLLLQKAKLLLNSTLTDVESPPKNMQSIKIIF